MPASSGFRTFQIVALIVICVLGTIGNILVILVVYRKRKMKTVTNYFIVNLAIADLAVLLMNVPLDVADLLAESNWLYGGFMCHIIRPLQTMATTASVWSLVAISISRYVAIVHPLKPQLRRTHARWMILPVWALSLVLVSPYMASLHMRNGGCEEDFKSVGMDPTHYTLGVFVTQYVIPLFIMAFAYIRVGQELTKNPNHDERTRTHYKETRKVIKMLTIVVFVFAILVLPLQVVQMWSDFFNGNHYKHYAVIRSVAIIMVYGNSFTNPIIYNACNEEFRKSFRGYFKMWIKPCARLVLGDRWEDDAPEILDDMGSTFHRTHGNGSFRRLSRRDTFTLAWPNANQNNTRKLSDRRNGNCNKTAACPNQTAKNDINKNDADNTGLFDAHSQHDTLLQKNCAKQCHHAVSFSKSNGVQFVSVL